MLSKHARLLGRSEYMVPFSALASKTRSNQKILIFYFYFFFKYEGAFTFLINLFLEARAEVLQIFQLLFWVN